MVQTNFSAGNAGSLTADLVAISNGGTDAAINTAYTIAMTAGVSLTADVALDAGSSLLLQGSFPFIVPAFEVTGTLITDLNLTGTVTLDKGVLENPALTTVGGTIVAGLYTGNVLGTVGDGGDTAINSGTIVTNDSLAAIEFDTGTVQNGWNGSAPAEISGAFGGVQFDSSGLLQNGGTIVASGATSLGVSIGALGGTVDNGQIGETGALISGGASGVQILGAGAVNNDGTIISVGTEAVYLSSGLVTNGQLGVSSALIDGSLADYGVWIGGGLGTVANFGSILGGTLAGAYLALGGLITNGAVSDPLAEIAGAAEGALLSGPGTLVNYGTVQGNVNVAPSSAVGAYLSAGGTIENLGTAALIGGTGWGVIVAGGAGFAMNLGMIQGAGSGDSGIEFTAGGTVVNGLTAGATATISGNYDGVLMEAGAAGAGATVLNDGTIEGTTGVDFLTGGIAAAGTLINDGLIESTTGTNGFAVLFGTGIERLVLESAGAFVGGVLGNNASGNSTTLELASGTQGTLSGLSNDGGTLTDGAGSFVFSAIGTIALDAGASWNVIPPGTFDVVNNAGALGVSGGSVTVSGSLTNSGSLSITNGTVTVTTHAVADQGIISVGPGGLLKTTGGGITAAGTPVILVGGGASSVLNVTGAGAIVNTGGYQLGIGSSGVGSALISQGGTILAGTPFAADEAIYTGGAAGSTGGLTVTDAGSLLRATGQFSVGLGGNGSLLIENQGTAITGNNAVDKSEGIDVGQLATGSGDITVTGTKSLLSNTGRFVVGDAGLGSLSIQSGATVTTSPGTVAGLAGAVIASQSGSGGSSVNVTGSGSTWQVGGSLVVGNAATGLLSITNGATVSATTLDAGVGAGSAGIVTISGPSTDLITTGSVSVGDTGSGELSILDGANATIAGDLNIANAGTGTGNVDIEDTTGTITFGGNIWVGYNGFGVLNIGYGVDYIQNNGGINFGPDSAGSINSFADPSPYLSNTSTSPISLGAQGVDQLAAYLYNSGEYTIPNSHTLTFDTPLISGGGSFSLGSGDSLILNADTVTGQTFSLGGNDKLTIGIDQLHTIETPPSGFSNFSTVTNPNYGDTLIGNFSGVIANFEPGDTIIVDTYGAATFSQSGSVVSVIENGTTLGVLTFDSATNAQAAFTTQGALVDNALCFLAGTLITTPAGQTAVERLAVGDLVLTASGVARPIVWIGQGRVLATRGRRNAATPVIVRKGALGPNVPHSDLRVTKGHSLWFDDVLIPVEFLVNHRSILWDDRAQEVVVYHVELETHDVLLANGAAAESYRDDGNRWLFQNANAGWDQAAKPPCAPVLIGGAVVDAVWRRLLDRAGARPSVPLTDDPDLHLMVDGVRLKASLRTGDALVFGLSTATAGVRVVSRAAVPQELGVARDARCLGVAVRRVVVRQGTRFRVLRGNDALLVDGFHGFEAGTGLRWTNGDATLPAAMFDGFSGACELVIHLGGTARYLDDGDMVAVA
jgi:fibronectin-binding autotransporter adhesin